MAFPGFSGGSAVKSSPANAGDAGLILGSEISPLEGNDNTFQYSSLGNPMDRGARQATSPWGCKRVNHDLAAKQQ